MPNPKIEHCLTIESFASCALSDNKANGKSFSSLTPTEQSPTAKLAPAFTYFPSLSIKGISLSSIMDESHGQINPKLATAAICQSYLLASFIA